jgi:UDP-N-acetylglucosamine 1-carboxyvinyltransferase
VSDKADASTQRRLVELGEQLRRTRRKLGISRAKLSERIGMHPMNYARIEQGKQNVTVEMLLRVAEGLEVELIVKFVARRKASEPGRRSSSG